MYSKEQASALRQAFWTTFGQYIAPQLSADGLRTNWINYKTGVKHLNFRMIAEGSYAEIAIELTHADAGIQEIYFEQFRSLRLILENALDESWEWQLHAVHDHGKLISKISKSIKPVSIYNRADWPALISFFKPRIIALDDFWSSAKYIFEALQ